MNRSAVSKADCKLTAAADRSILFTYMPWALALFSCRVITMISLIAMHGVYVRRTTAGLEAIAIAMASILAD